MRRIREQVRAGAVRIGPHAFQEMIMERPSISTETLLQALLSGSVLENYPEAPRGPKCLVNGQAKSGRPVHVVCTTGRADVLFVVTVYEPKPPKFISPTERGPGDEGEHPAR